MTFSAHACALALLAFDALVRAERLRVLLPPGTRSSLWRAYTLGPAFALIAFVGTRAGVGRALHRRRRPRPRRLAASTLLALSAALPCATGLPAQQRTSPPLGSRILPAGHPAYEYLWRLRTRGYVPQLNPLVQPYRRLDVARALAGLDPDSLPAPAAHWTRWLRREFARELERLAQRDAPAAPSPLQAPRPNPITERPDPGAERPGAQPASPEPQTGSPQPGAPRREPEGETRNLRGEGSQRQPASPEPQSGSSEPGARTHNPGRAGRNPQPATPNPGGALPNSPSAGIELRPGLRASTSQRLDPLRPLGSAGLWPRYALDAWVETGPLVLATGLMGDIYFWDDPDGLNPDQRRGGRSDNAYLALALPFGELALGRFQRNWGPPAAPGLMVSALPTSYPQIALEARLGRFTLRSFTAELDTLRGAKRYLAAHRLDYEAPDLVLSFGESILYAGGPGAPSLRYANPLAFLFFDQGKRPDYEENLTLDAQFWYRAGRTTFYGEFFLDDFEILDPPEDREPLQYAFTAGLRSTTLAPALELGIEYRQVGAWTYRTVAGIERYVFLNRGIGENYVDYDRLTLTLDLFPAVQGLRLTPALQLQRQGQQDLRGPDLAGFRWEDSTAILTGQIETTLRASLAARYSPTPNFWLEWDAGWNTTRNADHVAARSRSAFQATAALGITLPFRPPPRQHSTTSLLCTSSRPAR